MEKIKAIWKKVPDRFKNPWFWTGLLGVIAATIGKELESFTTWGDVGQALVDIVTNPYMLVGVILAVIGVFVDPNTPGLRDKHR